MYLALAGFVLIVAFKRQADIDAETDKIRREIRERRENARADLSARLSLPMSRPEPIKRDPDVTVTRDQPATRRRAAPKPRQNHCVICGGSCGPRATTCGPTCRQRLHRASGKKKTATSRKRS